VKVLGWELRKLRAQLRFRLALLICAVGPILLTVVLEAQTGLPKDTLFGRHVHDSGFAVPLLVLGFAGTWAFPLLTSVVAGDIFSAEDGYRTWPALLTRSRTRAELFTGKVVAACLSALVLLTVAAVSSLLAGVALVGSEALTGLSGTPIEPSRATTLVLLSWATAIPPLLGFTALAVLLSIVSRNSVIGIGLPVLAGLVMQLLSLLGALGRGANALLTTPFASWHGLMRDEPFYGPLWQGVLVSLVWTVACFVPARMVLLRRDVT
jgi:ABC-2 type transport system permease protein